MFRKVFCGFLLTSTLAMTAISSQALTPHQIMAKAAGEYKALHTFQAEYKMQMDMGQMGGMGMKLFMKMDPSAGKTYIKTEPAGKGTGQMAMAASFGQMIIVDDGKIITMYNPAINQYMTRPHTAGPAGSGMMGMYGMDMSQLQKLSKNVKMKMLPSTTVAGHPVYGIQMNVQLKNGMPPSIVKIYMDKNSYIMRKMVSGSDIGAMKMHMVMTLVSDKINAPIPASTFHFVIPKGATVMSAPMMGGAMGAPHH